MNQVFFCENTSRKLSLGSLCAKQCHLDCFSITITQHKGVMQHFPFSILFEFSVHSASLYLAKMSSDESSDSEMTYDSPDEEV